MYVAFSDGHANFYAIYCDLSQVAEAFLASRIPSTEGTAARGANFGGYAVYSEALTDSILARNMPVFEA